MNFPLKNSLLIFLACGIGGLLRYYVSSAVYLILGRNFPFGTLVVNVSGSFLAGLLLILILERYSGIGNNCAHFG